MPRIQPAANRAPSVWEQPPRPAHAVRGVPVETRETRERQDATIRVLELAVRRNARMGKGDGRRLSEAAK